jgi:hypothetical protein
LGEAKDQIEQAVCEVPRNLVFLMCESQAQICGALPQNCHEALLCKASRKLIRATRIVEL